MSETIIIIIKKEKKRKRKRKRKKQYAHISSLNDRVTNRNTCVLYLNRRRPLIKVLICVILDKWTEGERERERKRKAYGCSCVSNRITSHTHTHLCINSLGSSPWSMSLEFTRPNIHPYPYNVLYFH